MRKKTASGITVTLLLLGTLTMALNIPQIKAEPRTWTVDDDGPADFHTIQEAYSAASSGDTIYVHNGTYHEHLSIYKSLTLVGENKYGTIIDGSGYGLPGVVGIYYLTNVNFTRFTIRNAGQWPGRAIDWYGVESSYLSDNVFLDSYYGVVSFNGWYNIISGNLISNVDVGIELYNSRNDRVLGNIIENTRLGVSVTGLLVEHNTVAGNSISNSTDIAIFFNAYWGGNLPSYYNTVASNSISNSSNSGIYFNLPYHNTIMGNTVLDSTHGIHLEMGGSNNTVTGNTVSGSDEAIEISYADNNAVSGNIVSNSYFGIGLREHSDNNIVKNNVVSNNYYGIVLFSSDRSKIYHNNFINNVQQVLSSGSANTTWDNGYRSGGNYWSDYTGVDLLCGPDQNETGSDGIGDTQYIIDNSNQDRYPLITFHVQLLGDINDDRKVDGKDISVAAKAFASYLGHPRWNPQADLNQDNKIDGKDIAKVAKNFGKT